MAQPTLAAQIIDGIKTEKNYILGQVEKNVAGWLAYADAAGIAPVDGDGGAPVGDVTWGLTTTNPISDSASFQLVKPAANRQGEGKAYAFTIDRGMRYKVNRVFFKYESVSGTFNFGDGTTADPSSLRVFIFDVTNGVLIEPTQTMLDGSGDYFSEFQASDSTSYRLLLHIADATSNAWTMNFDLFSVGPRELARGFFGSDWAAFTPSFNDATNVTYSGKMRRNGDVADFVIKAAYTGAGASVSLIFSLPFGLKIDASKVLETNDGVGLFGVGHFFDASAAASANVFLVGAIARDNTLDTDNVRIGAFTTDDWKQFNPASVPVATANGDVFTIRFSVPIKGWGSNTVLSSDAGTRSISALVGITADQTVSATTETTINFNVTRFDTAGIASASDNGFKVKDSGPYFARVNTYITGNTALDNTVLRIKVNGSTAPGGEMFYPLASTIGTYSHAIPLMLNAGDVVTATIDSAADASYTLDSAIARSSFSLHKIQSPQTVGMADKNLARYTTNAGQSIPASTITIVDFEDKDYDFFNSVTTGASWKWTASQAGIADISATLSFAGNTWAINDIVAIYIYKNGSLLKLEEIEFFSTPSGAINISYSIRDRVKVVAGDYLDIRVQQTNASSRALNTSTNRNVVSISLE